MTVLAKSVATSIAAARDQLEMAVELLSASLTGLEGERTSTLRYSYLVARSLGFAALDRAREGSSRLRGDVAKYVADALVKVQHRASALRELERAAISAGALSLTLVLDEIAEQLTERNLDARVDELLDLASIGKPLIEPLLSEGERVRIVEYAFERASKRLVLDAVLGVFPASSGEALSFERSRPRFHDDLFEDQPGPVGLLVVAESRRTLAQDDQIREAFGHQLRDLASIIKAAFTPFVSQHRLASLPPLAPPPKGSWF